MEVTIKQEFKILQKTKEKEGTLTIMIPETFLKRIQNSEKNFFLLYQRLDLDWGEKGGPGYRLKTSIYKDKTWELIQERMNNAEPNIIDGLKKMEEQIASEKSIPEDNMRSYRFTKL
jgi:hypothetical protein